MQKKAQVTIFIIIGIIIVSAIIFLFTFIDVEKINSQFYSSNIEPFVVNCLESTTESGIFFIGLQGGYFEVDNPKLEVAPFDIPLYFVNGTYMQSPTLEDVESELSNYVETKIFDCLNNFSMFDNLKIEYEKRDINVEISIRDKKVIADLFLPVIINKKNSSIIHNEFYVEIKSNFRKRFQAVEEYVEKQKLEPNKVMVYDLYEIANKTNLKVDLHISPGNNVVFKFIDDETHALFSNYTFAFAIKYKGEK